MMICNALGRQFKNMSNQNGEIRDDADNIGFRKGMGNIISTIRSHVSSNVIMANMASLLTMIDSRFILSHDIS